MNRYCLYYFPPNEEEFSDSLFVYFGGVLTGNKIIKGYKLNKLYHNETVIGYLIFNFSSYCKIRYSGQIFMPNEELITIINNILTDEGVENIEYLSHSGFYVGQIKNKQILKESFLYKVDVESTIYVESTFDLNIDDIIVVALNDTYLLPGKLIQPYEIAPHIISGGRICSNDDLNMSDNDLSPVIIQEDVEIGQDFFKVERRVYDA